MVFVLAMPGAGEIRAFAITFVARKLRHKYNKKGGALYCEKAYHKIVYFYNRENDNPFVDELQFCHCFTLHNERKE